MNWRKWLDDCGLAGRGILLATRERRFWYGFVPTLVGFSMLINLLSGGLSKFELMGATGFSGTMKILGDAFLATFGYGQAFFDWLSGFLLAFLQGVLVGLIVVLWQKKQRSREDGGAGENSGNRGGEGNAANVERAGLITGLVALGAGCPTCGTTLVTPLLGTIFSTGGMAVAGVVSTVVTVIAVVVALLALKRLGLETYVMIVNEKYLAKQRKKKEENEKVR